MEKMEVCLYHSDRCYFDMVYRGIEKAKIIPRNYSKRLAMCVCSCKKNKFNLSGEIKQLEIQDMARFLEDYIKTENWPVSLESFLKPLLRDICIQQYSPSMLVLVLYRAVKLHNYDLLKSSVKKEETNKTNQQKMTPMQFRCMMNKKWKNSQHHLDLTIPLFAGNTKLLLNDNRVKQFQLMFKDVALKIDHKTNSEFMEKNLKKTKIKFAGKSKENVHEIGCQLNKIGAEIQNSLDQKRSAEYERRQEIYRARRSFDHDSQSITNDSRARQSFDHDGQSITNDSLEYKEEMTDLYARRHDANKHSSTHKVKSGASSPLKDGHCLNCLAKFVTLKNTDSCKFHPGFIGRDKKWSCCYLEADCDQPTEKEHKTSGCFTGSHNWRHGKDEKKKKQMKQKNRILHQH